MRAAEIDSRAVFKVVGIALFAIAAALLLALALVEVRTTLRWLAAAIFLAMVLAPAVALVERIPFGKRRLPRPAAIAVVFLGLGIAMFVLVLQVIPPMVDEVENLGTQAPGYVSDFEDWANNDSTFNELNDKYDLTATLSKQAAELPAKLGDAAGELKVLTVALLRNAFAAITVLVLAFFLLLEGRGMIDRGLGQLRPEHQARGQRIADRIYEVVKGYVTVNLGLAVAAGIFTWLMLELIGIEIAVPLAILVGFCDLVPLIGLTIGGLVVAIAAGLHSFPGALILWVVAFLIYQQLQDRVVQPLLYGRAVSISPLVAIVALFAGAQILGILGALLAIPVAASIGVVFTELRGAGEEPEPAPAQAEPAGS